MTGDWPVPSLGIFVMVDQLEDMFISARQAMNREEFFHDIRMALDAIPRLRILLSVREESLADLSKYTDTLFEAEAAYFLVPPLDRESAVAAVRGPMERVGLTFARTWPTELPTSFGRSTSRTPLSGFSRNRSVAWSPLNCRWCARSFSGSYRVLRLACWT